MTYSEALFFIGKCLTLGLCPDRIGEIREQIRSGSVEWERIVWVSTGQFVFPALYLQLKQAALLPELPPDLVEYMEEFAAMNRDRNRQIIDQALEIADLLNKHEISPVFLKGTAHLLDNLYEDIAGRMVGDIDFLVDGKDMVRAAEILIATGYEPLATYNPKNLIITKHYPRLKNDNRTVAVEVHRQILHFPYYKEFDGGIIVKESKKLDLPGSPRILCDEHQVIHNILNVQVNDNGFYYAQIFLRQMYDLLLISRKTNPLTVIGDFGKFYHRMNGNLAVTNKIFDNPASIPYDASWQAKMFLHRIRRNINHPGWARFSHTCLYYLMRFSSYPKQLIRAVYNKEARRSVFARLSDPKWYGAHLRSYRREA
ncbi:MAG: nucleotidyltransferase family protein [Bacteroidia bacterium]|nr:nucleotidyltransferase family protein [Bacteroidia bacterium]